MKEGIQDLLETAKDQFSVLEVPIQVQSFAHLNSATEGVALEHFMCAEVGPSEVEEPAT